MRTTLIKLVQRRGRQQATLLTVCAALFVSVLNGTMLNVSLPVIGEDLGVEPARLGWIVTGYLLVFGVSVPFYGRLADVFGARRLFVLGLCVYSVSSLFCALSFSYPMLLGARLLQGLGAAAIPGLGMAIISGVYPPDRRGAALGYVSATVGTSAAIGPLVGGTVSSLLNWHFMFLLSSLAGLLVPFAARLLPEGDRRPGERIDLLGGVLLGLSVSGALLAATEGSRGGVMSPVVIGAVATSILAMISLVVRQRTAQSPFLPRELLRNRGFLALQGTSFCVMASNVATFVSLPLMLRNDYRLSLLVVGLVLLPNSIVVALLGPVVGRTADRTGGRLLVRTGLLLILIAQLLLSAFGVGSSVWVVMAMAALQGTGFALLNSPLATMVSLAVSKEHQASGLSLNNMAFFLGGGFGTALLTALLTVREGARTGLNPLYAGREVAFSDAFLLFSLPLLIALALSLALPDEEHAAPEAEPPTAPQPARAAAQR